jgi:nucleoporin p58/p45
LQKSICEDISSASEKPLSKVQDDVKSTSQALSLLAHTVHADGQAVHDLKYQAVQELKNAEIAQKTKETPPMLQHENTLPAEYFRTVVQSFEQQMQTYRQQIDDMENYMAALTGEMSISPQVLAEVIRKLHESFIALAGQIQASHEAVKVQKEQYLNYRKAFLKDTTDVFEVRRRVQSSETKVV